METTAPGYLLDQKSLSGDLVAIPTHEPFGLFGAKEPPPVSLVAELYAEPGPTIELVLPSGYKGLVRVEVRPRDDVPCPPGQRRFRYDVSPSGEVVATGPALLRRLPNFVASYADGAPLSVKAKDDEVGWRWLKSDGVRETFVVGTLAEFYYYLMCVREGGRGNESGGTSERRSRPSAAVRRGRRESVGGGRRGCGRGLRLGVAGWDRVRRGQRQPGPGVLGVHVRSPAAGAEQERENGQAPHGIPLCLIWSVEQIPARRGGVKRNRENSPFSS